MRACPCSCETLVAMLTLRDTQDASSVLHMFAPDVITPQLKHSFQDQFERMIVLDYITRNTGMAACCLSHALATAGGVIGYVGVHGSTISPSRIARQPDRGHENWLIKVEKKADSTDSHWPGDVEEWVRIAAIDNGLSFPFKHPDTWRTCV